MKVRAVWNKYTDRTSHIARDGGAPRSQSHLTIGKEYEVYSISFYDGCLNLLIIDDTGTESFKPSWFFEVLDRSLPRDWEINLFNDEEPQGIIGPEFFVRDGESYNALVEEQPDAVEKFVKYVLEHKKKAEPDDI
jgi:hypothetical protein